MDTAAELSVPTGAPMERCSMGAPNEQEPEVLLGGTQKAIGAAPCKALAGQA